MSLCLEGASWPVLPTPAVSPVPEFVGRTLIANCAGQPAPSNSALTQIARKADCRARIPSAAYQVGSLLESGLLFIQVSSCSQSSSRCLTVPANDDFQKGNFQNHKALDVLSISTYSFSQAGTSLYLDHCNKSQLIVSQGISKIYLLVEKSFWFSERGGMAQWVFIYCTQDLEQVVFALCLAFLV